MAQRLKFNKLKKESIDSFFSYNFYVIGIKITGNGSVKVDRL